MRIVKRIAVAVVALMLAIVLYGVAIEPRLIVDEERHRVELPGLDPRWDGAEVAVISDLQVGMWLDNTGMIERIVDRIVDEDPAAALIAGDFLYNTGPDSTPAIGTVIEVLAPLRRAGIPTFAVLGNHDYAVGAAETLTVALQAAGIRVLRNDAAQLEARDPQVPPLYIVGLGPETPPRADPDQALREVPDGAPRLVMMHNPLTFPRLPAGAAPFAVAGHTHCGQLALPGTPRWSYIELAADEVEVVDGFSPDDYGAPGNQLYVTCGIGFSVVPIRINAPPQVVFLTLSPAS